MHNFKSIKNWASEDRPREKLMEKGASVLSNSELLAILINTGMINRSALDIAKDLLIKANHDLLDLSKFSIEDYKHIKGMGPQKAVTLMAALELGKRRQMSSAKERPHIRLSKDLFEHFAPYFFDSKVEEFYCMFLNNANQAISIEAISNGGLTATIVDFRLIFKRAFELNGITKIAVAHNHPSGNLLPSTQDVVLTQKLKQAAQLLDIQLIDHLIVANNQYYSFDDERKLT
jgi:DNA repair protein RadC